MDRRHALAALAGLTAGHTVAASTRSSSERILIGQSAALTGPAGELGVQFRLGADLCFNRVNQQGGVAGRMLELRSLDDGYEPQRCIHNTRELIDDGALALFGYVGTANSLAALPMASSAQRLFFAPFTGSEAVRIPYNPVAFHLRASYVDETQAIVKHLTSVGMQRIGVFYQNDGDGKAGLVGIARAMKLQYQSPAGIGVVERNSTAVDAAVKSILAGKPDAIVQISTYRSCAAFIKAARRAGFEGVFYNISLVGAQALAQELGAESRGVVVSQVMPFPFTPTTRIAGEFLAVGRETLGLRFAPSYTSMEGYVAAKTLVEGLRRTTGNLTVGSVTAGLETLRDFDMGGFRVDFAPNRHVASKFIDLTILTTDQKVRR
jgi:branched-chain amino acid transport system substrate-binding protein